MLFGWIYLIVLLIVLFAPLIAFVIGMFYLSTYAVKAWYLDVRNGAANQQTAGANEQLVRI